MSKYDDNDDWESEAQAAFENPALNEFKALQRRLRRNAGYDLRWWERLILKAARVLRLKIKFN